MQMTQHLHKPIHVCLSCDDAYTQHCGVTIASILVNAAPEDRLVFHVLDGGISETNKKNFEKLQAIRSFELQFVRIRDEDFADCPIRPGDHVSLATYFRLKIPDLLCGIDKVIYLDCDLVANGSLSELFSKDITDHPIGMVPEPQDASEGHKKRLNLTDPSAYCNAGVLLINCKKWREERLCERLFEYVAQNSDILKLHDQDTLNLVFRGKIKELGARWNLLCSLILADFEMKCAKIRVICSPAMLRSPEELDSAKIIHFASDVKPWSGRAIHPATAIYYKYLRLTAWHHWHQIIMIRMIAHARILRRFFGVLGI